MENQNKAGRLDLFSRTIYGMNRENGKKRANPHIISKKRARLGGSGALT